MPALLINLSLTTNKIRLLRINESTSLSQVLDLTNAKHDSRKDQREVTRDEASHIERIEDIIADENESQTSDDEGKQRSPWRVRRSVGELIVGQALGLSSTVEAEVGNEHEGVGGDEGCGCEVDEPEEDFDGGVGGDEEGDARDGGNGEDTPDRDTGFGALHEEFGSLAVWRGSQHVVEV